MADNDITSTASGILTQDPAQQPQPTEPGTAPAPAAAEPGKNTPAQEQQITLPGENASPEELNAFYQRLGRPDSADGYEFTEEQTLAKDLAPALFEAGISRAQAGKLVAAYENLFARRTEEMQAVQVREMDELKAEWGGKYEENLTLAKQAVKKYGLDQETLNQLESAMGSKKLMNLAYTLGKTTMDAPVRGAVGPTPKAAYSPAEAQAKMEEMKHDKAFGAKLLAGDKEAAKQFDDVVKAMAGAR